MDEIAMGAMNLDRVESRGQCAARRGREGADQVLDLRLGQRARRRIAFALRGGAGRHAFPGGFRPVAALDRRGAVPRTFGAGAASCMAALDAAGGAIAMVELGDAAQPGDLAVVPDAGAA